jgi:hypothetical protein
MDRFAEATLDPSPLAIKFGHMSIYAATVDRTIKHVVCYVARGSDKGSYLKCVDCGLIGHTMEKCFRLINLCLA